MTTSTPVVKSFTLLVFLSVMLIGRTLAQVAPNCSASAGDNQVICGSTAILVGSADGDLDGSMSPSWQFVSGPGPFPLIASPNDLTTEVTGMGATGDYVFQLLVPCENGEWASSLVTVTKPVILNSNAGSDQTMTCGTTVSLAGSTAGAGIGTWLVTTAPVGATPVLVDPNAQLATVNGLTEDGIYEFTWEITSAIGNCKRSDVVRVTRNCALPVRLISFTAKNDGENKSLLQWSTASEENSKGFSIERSSDAKSWSAISFVNSKHASGNSTDKQEYSYVDQTPNPGVNYYRLKQTDLDNTFAYSKISLVEIGGKIDMNVFPNPANDKIDIEGLHSGDRIFVVSATGAALMRIKAKGAKETIGINRLGSGVYVVQVVRGNALYFTKRIVKTQ